MARDRQPVCITCGQPIARGSTINRLEDGAACPTCRDRLLDALPSLLPSQPGQVADDIEIEAEGSPPEDDPIGA